MKKWVDKYFKNGLLSEWRDDISLVDRIFATIILMSPFFLFSLYISLKQKIDFIIMDKIKAVGLLIMTISCIVYIIKLFKNRDKKSNMR